MTEEAIEPAPQRTHRAAVLRVSTLRVRRYLSPFAHDGPFARRPELGRADDLVEHVKERNDDVKPKRDAGIDEGKPDREGVDRDAEAESHEDESSLRRRQSIARQLRVHDPHD